MQEVNRTILVIADSNFKNLCDDPKSYIDKLYSVLKGRHDVPVSIVTVSGRYGLSDLDEGIGVLEVEDRNKTLFVQTIENAAANIDELQIVSLSESDPFIEGAAGMLSSLHKNITRYGYKRR